MKPVVRLRATLHYCHAMLVYWLAVCSEQVAIQISFCCLSKRFFIWEYCELTAMASNITSVSKREKVISLWSSGYRNKEICSRLHLSHQTVSNILSKFLQNGTAAPGKPGWKERTVATPNVVEFVEYCKVLDGRFFHVNWKSCLTISDIVERAGRLAGVHMALASKPCCISKVRVLGLNTLQYSTNNHKLQLARSKLPIKIPTLRDNIAKWRANEQPASL